MNQSEEFQFHLTFRHMESSEAIRNHAAEKIEKIKKYILKPNRLNMTLTVDNFRHQAEITLTEDHTQFIAKAESTDMYQSIDEVVTKMEKQLKKHKEKSKNHH